VASLSFTQLWFRRILLKPCPRAPDRTQLNAVQCSTFVDCVCKSIV